MCEYELIPREPVSGAFRAKYDVLDHAIEAAKALSEKYRISVAVVRVVGVVANESRWIDNGWIR